MKKFLAIFMTFVMVMPNSFFVFAAEDNNSELPSESLDSSMEVPSEIMDNGETENVVDITDIEIEGYVSKFDEQSGDYIFEPIEEIEMMAIEDIYSINPEDIDLETRNFGEYIVEECGLESDDIQNIGDENGITTVASALPDLSVTYLNATTDLLTGQTSRFSYKVSNLGGSIAKDVEMAFIVEDGLAGTFNLGDIEAGKTANAYFVLGAIQNKGRYGIGVYADFNNKIEESDETNNFYGKYFTWYDEEDYNPDLTVEILAPASGKISGAKDADDTKTVSFRIYNEGPKPTPTGQKFDLYVYIDGRKFAGMRVSDIPAFTGFPGSFKMGITGYKPFEMEMEIDALDEIVETNENNNSDSRNYSPYYCIHRSKNIKNPPYPAEDIKVQIESSAFFGLLNQNVFSKALGAWNGITDKVRIKNVTVSDVLNPDTQILIRSDLFPDDDFVFGDTIEVGNGGKPMIAIKLNKDLLLGKPESQYIRTIVHELGHGFGMDHPALTPASCGYPSIMYTSNHTNDNVRVDVVTSHDKFALIDRYNELSTSSASIQDKEADIIHDVKNIYGDKIIQINSENILSEAEYIVKGRILPESENILVEYSGYTKTPLLIEEVYKGDGFHSGDVINLREPYYLRDPLYLIPREDCEMQMVCRDAYRPSKEGEEYIFFLNSREEEEAGLYSLPFTSLSRYALNNDDIIEFPDSNNPDYTIENYNALKKQVLETYN